MVAGARRALALISFAFLIGVALAPLAAAQSIPPLTPTPTPVATATPTASCGSILNRCTPEPTTPPAPTPPPTATPARTPFHSTPPSTTPFHTPSSPTPSPSPLATPSPTPTPAPVSSPNRGLAVLGLFASGGMIGSAAWIWRRYLS